MERIPGNTPARRCTAALAVAVLLLALPLACAPLSPDTAPNGDLDAAALHFEAIHQRILVGHSCLDCHFDDNPDEAAPLTSYEAVLEVVVPGHPGMSDLYTYVHSGKMPKKRPRMNATDEHFLEAWIAAGAPR